MLHPTSNAKKGQGLTQLTWPPTSFRGVSQPESFPGHLQVPPQGPLPGVLMQSHHWERAEDEEEEAGLSRGSCAEIKGTKASHPKLQENLIIKDKTPSVCVDCDLMLAPGFNSS